MKPCPGGDLIARKQCTMCQATVYRYIQATYLACGLKDVLETPALYVDACCGTRTAFYVFIRTRSQSLLETSY